MGLESSREVGRPLGPLFTVAGRTLDGPEANPPSSSRRESTVEPRPISGCRGRPRLPPELLLLTLPPLAPIFMLSWVITSPGRGEGWRGRGRPVVGGRGNCFGEPPPSEERTTVSGNGAGFWLRGGLEPTGNTAK